MTNSFMLVSVGHLIVFSLVTVTFNGTFREFRPEFFFWGSIVRKEELVPGKIGQWNFSMQNMFALSREKGAYSSIWGKGIAVDKTEMQNTSKSFTLPDPLKFLGPRVILDNDQDGEARHFDLPALPKVKLRYPRP